MKFGSLFAGVGGFDLGLERSGMTCQWQVEIEDYPTKILEKHWPEVHRERDIKECSGENLEPVDLICGGFPCQDISVAGTGAGLAGERSGLWYEMYRIISDIKPRWVIVENVAALLHRGMDVVLRDLSQVGYDCEWHIISASAVGAPHRRERVWIIANANGFGTQIQAPREKPAKQMLERFSWWKVEPGVDRMAHGVPERMARLKAIGNAVVPQIVELIGRRIMEIEGNL